MNMNRFVGVASLALVALLVNGSVFAQTKKSPTSEQTKNKSNKCKFSEGDDFTARGNYLMGDTCDLVGNVEAVNKECTKVKVRVSKVTAAFGIQVNAACRVGGGVGGAGDVIWLSAGGKG